MCITNYHFCKVCLSNYTYQYCRTQFTLAFSEMYINKVLFDLFVYGDFYFNNHRLTSVRDLSPPHPMEIDLQHCYVVGQSGPRPNIREVDMHLLFP